MAAVEVARTTPPASNDDATAVSSAHPIETAIGGASAGGRGAGVVQATADAASANVADKMCFT
jgi:hypothetical protein